MKKHISKQFKRIRTTDFLIEFKYVHGILNRHKMHIVTLQIRRMSKIKC